MNYKSNKSEQLKAFQALIIHACFTNNKELAVESCDNMILNAIDWADRKIIEDLLLLSKGCLAGKLGEVELLASEIL